MKRREFIAILVGAAAASSASWRLAARAQQVPVVGFLGGGLRTARASLIPAFRHGLAEAGYIEAPSAPIEFRWAEGAYDRLPERRGRRRKMTDDPKQPAQKPHQFRDAAQCGARTRAGKPCRSPVVTGRRRCRMHGGALGSGGPKGVQARPLHHRSDRLSQVAEASNTRGKGVD
jgi:hypothetical protein